ncbi:hypothetical protein GLW08_13660 [Pontibacillus yanchengensis]|uniref:Uncharacterized protein n=2 Tax=Pontibacillus yanchengensis TaxID=462910 RepID=A0ACC7VIC8_9BACI|nr:hypothetical protein [Pontibacillus yanchengensis]MYL35979.1 hypothetical protein [Pontibacillus yanchengensis]MYL54375.1 hypothetical protein [Pontibacillus yanchengensis]
MTLLQKAVEIKRNRLFKQLVEDGLYKRTDILENITLAQLERDFERRHAYLASKNGLSNIEVTTTMQQVE